MTKPYDPTPILNKIQQYEDDYNERGGLGGNLDLNILKNCCSEVAIIKDAKDFKPFIMASLDQFAEIMELDANRYKQRRRYD
jgi:hypothetical protein